MAVAVPAGIEIEVEPSQADPVAVEASAGTLVADDVFAVAFWARALTGATPETGLTEPEGACAVAVEVAAPAVCPRAAEGL